MEIYTNLTPCANGHYFNRDTHAVCPVCGAPAADNGNASFRPTENASGSFSSADYGQGAGSFGATVAPYSTGFSAPAGGQPASIGATEPVNNPHMTNTQSKPFSETMSVMQIAGQKEDAPQVDPVVGWLVCIDGPMKGNDYRIHAGYNYIGREIGDIHIRGDQTISRQRHARISFDHETNQYFFGPDEGRNLLRVNGKTIMVPVELHNYDILTVGQTKLMFVGLCGEHFSWG